MITQLTTIFKRFLSFTILALAALHVQAQGVSIFDSKKGLSNSQVQTLYEDSRNNIWITTRSGLNRFDGVKINAYRHSSKDASSLLHDITTCVFEYDRNNLLVGTDAGLQTFCFATNKFTTIPYINGAGDTVKAHIISMCRLKSGKMLACNASYGIAVIEKKSDGTLIAHQSTEFNTGVDASPIRLYEDSKGRIWIINVNGQLYVREKGKTRLATTTGSIRKVCASSSGRIYIASLTDGLLVYSEQTKSFTPVSRQPQNNDLWSISPWTEGRIFICTDGEGLKVYDEKTGIISQSPIQVSDFNLATSNVKDVLCDSYGSVWVGIYWKGVMQKPASKSAFDYIGRLSITRNTIGSNSVTAMAQNGNDKVWVATDHCGLYCINANGTESTHWSPESTPGMPSTINALCNDKGRGRLWLGSFATGLSYMDISSGRVATLNKQIPRVFDIKMDNEGALWVATIGSGVFYYNPSTDEVVNYTGTGATKDKNTSILKNSYVSCLLLEKGRLYLGTSDGLESYRITNHNILKYERKILTTIYVYVLKHDGNKIWAATNVGLYIIDENTGKTTQYTVDNGLPNNVVNSIEFDGSNVWVGTDFGLACISKDGKKCHSFFTDDGLQDNEFSTRASVKIGDTFYFGGISGINYFSSTSIKQHPSSKEFKLRLINLYVNSKQIHAGDMSNNDYDILEGDIDEVNEVNLAYNDNHFSLELAALGLGYRHAIYEYSIDGGEWTVQSEQSNTIIFANIKPGTHKIKIRARTYQAVSDERQLTVIVHHPWYSSPTAWCIYILLTVLIGWIVYTQAKHQIKARRILANHRKEEEMNEARIQFFMNISHEIRTPMTLIFAPLEKLMSSDKDEEHQRSYRLIHQNSKRIMRLINQMMDARKIEKGQYRLDFRPMELVDFMQSICDVFTTSAQNRSITFTFHHSMEKLYAKADPENLDKIVMNLLSNAFKFTPDCGKIELDLSTDRSNIIIKVTDTGTGISEADKPKIFERFYSAQHQNGYIGTGIGLNLTYLIVKMHKGTITVKDNPTEQGTQFVISIPLIEVNADSVSPLQDEEVEKHEEQTVTLPIEKLKGARHRNVLVVEDDAAIRSYIHSELSTDMVITECSNGQEGWDAIIKNPDKIDLIISDVMMPVMDGITLCQKIKQNFTTSHLPVILITALGSDADRIAGITNGADAYVTKPFNIDVLRSTAINLLNSRLTLRGKFSAEVKTEENIEKREIESADEHLLSRVVKVVNENMEDPDLSVEAIADKVGISRVHFYRKMKELTGQSPRDFLKSIRLKEAARLLTEKRLDITSVCAATGFKTLSTFSTTFKSVYGVSPSEYANRERKPQQEEK